MGMYDSVYFSCPRCRTGLEGQSKTGECSLHSYSSEEVPREVVRGVLGDKLWCEKCRATWLVIEAPVQAVRLALVEV